MCTKEKKMTLFNNSYPPLMSNGLFYRCSCYVSGPWLWFLHCGQWEAHGMHQKYLNLCSEDERRSYGFGTKLGRVINDRIVIFGWTIPLMLYIVIYQIRAWDNPNNMILSTAINDSMIPFPSRRSPFHPCSAAPPRGRDITTGADIRFADKRNPSGLYIHSERCFPKTTTFHF